MKHPHRTALSALTLAALAMAPAFAQQQQSRLTDPSTKTIEHVDNYFGAKVADPYRWMEDLNTPELADWVRAQNALTESYLAKLPLRGWFKNRITELWNYPKVSIPFREGGR